MLSRTNYHCNVRQNTVTFAQRSTFSQVIQYSFCEVYHFGHSETAFGRNYDAMYIFG